MTGQQRRLLIVEDQPDAAGVLARLAKRFQYQTLIAESGKTALEIASWWSPDVLMIDLRMAGMDGFEVASAVRPQLPDAKLIAVSGHPATQGELDEAGFDSYLKKPVTYDHLKNELADAH